MRRLRSFLVALVVFAVIGPLTSSLEASQAERRHPRPGQHREREYRHDERQQRHYRPYRPNYRYQHPLRHYLAPRYGYTCRVWVYSYWAYDAYGEYWVPAHYGYVSCH